MNVSLRTREMLRYVRGPLVLDVGCADHVVRPDHPGWLHAGLASAFPDIWGIDVNADAIERMRVLGYRNLHVADAQRFALGQRFDTIIASEVIEHLENPGEFLRSCLEHLTPDGRVVLTTPSPFHTFTMLYAV